MKTEEGRRMTEEDRRRKTEDGRPKTEDRRRRKTEDGRPKGGLIIEFLD